ncbi:hypothetical protein UP15_07440 [Bacillus pumilus]|nr:hypothetical protein UP15_07440 [Bacillus pumilus]
MRTAYISCDISIRLLTKGSNELYFGSLSSFQRDRKPLQSRKDEHRSAGLTPNARVCLHAAAYISCDISLFYADFKWLKKHAIMKA